MTPNCLFDDACKGAALTETSIYTQVIVYRDDGHTRLFSGSCVLFPPHRITQHRLASLSSHVTNSRSQVNMGVFLNSPPIWYTMHEKTTM